MGMWLKTVAWLFKWEKSIYKTLWLHTAVYTSLFYGLSLLYKFVLNAQQRKAFESISLAFSKLPDTITLVLILGFIATQIMARWASLYLTIPGTSKIITSAQFYVKPTIPNRSAWCRTLARYIILSWLLFIRTMSRPMKRKFPTLESIQKVGLIMKHEVELLRNMSELEDESKCSLYVVHWAIYLIRQAKDDGYFENSNDVARCFEPILAFKQACSRVLKHRVTEFPQKFFQLLAILVLSFGVFTLMGRQFVDPSAKVKVLFMEAMYYIPILPTEQYLVFLAWLRLAMECDDAFGEDDTDFDMMSVFVNHVEAADNLLRLFDQNQFNPTEQSLAMTQQSLFRQDDSVKIRPLRLLLDVRVEEVETEFMF